MICLSGLVTQDLHNWILDAATLVLLLEELDLETKPKAKTDMEMNWHTHFAWTKDKVMLVGLSAQRLIAVKNLMRMNSFLHKALLHNCSAVKAFKCSYDKSRCHITYKLSLYKQTFDHNFWQLSFLYYAPEVLTLHRLMIKSQFITLVVWNIICKQQTLGILH